MMSKMYSVFDAKLAVFSHPWYALTDAAAIRSFTDAVNDPNSPRPEWGKHPEDFSLFYIGDFYDDTGHVEAATPVSLVTASAIAEVMVEKFLNGVNKKEPARK